MSTYTFRRAELDGLRSLEQVVRAVVAGKVPTAHLRIAVEIIDAAKVEGMLANPDGWACACGAIVEPYSVVACPTCGRSRGPYEGEGLTYEEVDGASEDEIADWRYEVANGDTVLGLHDWRAHCREVERLEAQRGEARKFYECGICGFYHPASFDGDCRQDNARFAAGDLDARYGPHGWEEVEQPS